MSQERGSTAAIGDLATRGFRPKRTFLQNVGMFARRKPLGAFGAIVGVVLVVVAIFASQIATHDPQESSVAHRFAPPGSERLLGGDQLGRDVFSRLIYGARISLQAGLFSALIGCTLGLLVGVASVHFGGITDLIVQRLVDSIMAFPAIILAIALVSAMGASLTNVIIALSILYVPATARIVRSQALAIKEMDYVLAARAVGAGDLRIMTRHMIPNLAAVYIVLVTFYLGIAIVAEASLSFLGLGIPPNEPSWGGMLSVAQNHVEEAPWLAIVPGIAIAVVVFAWNLLGDSLRDVLDPRMRGTS